MIKLHKPNYNEEHLLIAKLVLESGQLVNGKYTKKFEENFAKYCQTKHCITTSNGTDALFLALKAAKIKKGDSVLVPALTFFATIEAVMHTGAKPIFVDINPLTWCMDYNDMIKKFDDTIKACIPVHLFGQPCHEIIEISNYCKAMGITLIEDCCQSHGAKVDSYQRHDMVGSFGKMGIFSFMASKNLPCSGEGGAIVTGYPFYEKKLRLLKQHGMIDRDTHQVLGYNSKMSEIECGIAALQLIDLDKNNDLRIKNSEYLRDMLESIKWLQPQVIPKDTKNVFFWCAFRIHENILRHSTDWLIEELKNKGIEVRHRYKKPLYHQPVIQDAYPVMHYDCPNAEEIAGKLIGLPNGPHLKKEDLRKIIRVMKSIDKNK